MDEEYDYIGHDLAGYSFNMKYPPTNLTPNANFLGYPSWNRQAFFFEFAVQGYDMSFDYKGETYYLLYDEDGAGRCRVPFNDVIEKFESPNALIEQMEIDGKKLIEVIDLLENVEIH